MCVIPINTQKKTNKSCPRRQDLSFKGLMFLTGASLRTNPGDFAISERPIILKGAL